MSSEIGVGVRPGRGCRGRRPCRLYDAVDASDGYELVGGPICAAIAVGLPKARRASSYHVDLGSKLNECLAPVVEMTGAGARKPFEAELERRNLLIDKGVRAGCATAAARLRDRGTGKMKRTPRMRFSGLLVALLFGCSTEPALVLDVIPNWSSWSDEGVVVPRGSGNIWDNKEVMPQGIVKRGDTYYLYYIGAKRSCNCVRGSFPNADSAIGLATSKDGVTFTKHPNNPIVRHEMDPKSEEDGIRVGFVQFDDHTNQFVMLYGGEDTVSPGNAEVDSWVYYRTSSDGIQWSSERAVRGIGAKGGEAYPDGMVRANGKYHLWWHYAEGPTMDEGQWHYYADGRTFGEFTTRGKIAGLNMGWTSTTPWLHPDGDTVSLFFSWNSPSRTDPYTSIAKTKLSEPLRATVKRWTTDGYALRPNLLLDGSTWRLYSMNHENKGEGAARVFTAPVSAVRARRRVLGSA